MPKQFVEEAGNRHEKRQEIWKNKQRRLIWNTSCQTTESILNYRLKMPQTLPRREILLKRIDAILLLPFLQRTEVKTVFGNFM